MAEQQVADRLRDFALRHAIDEDIDFIEAAYEDGDVDELRDMAEAVARYSGHPVPDLIAA